MLLVLRSRCGRAVAGVYFALALLAGGVSAQRLAASTELPGLAAIELLVLTLPWSLLLEAPLGRQGGWLLMTAIVCSGVLLNTVALYTIGFALERWWRGT